VRFLLSEAAVGAVRVVRRAAVRRAVVLRAVVRAAVRLVAGLRVVRVAGRAVVRRVPVLLGVRGIGPSPPSLLRRTMWERLEVQVEPGLLTPVVVVT
jgi:hypothetical protein